MNTIYANNHETLIPFENLVIGKIYKMDVSCYPNGWQTIYAELLKKEFYPLQPYATWKFYGYVDDNMKNKRGPWYIINCGYRLCCMKNVLEENKTADIIYCLNQKDIELPSDIICDLYEFIQH